MMYNVKVRCVSCPCPFGTKVANLPSIDNSNYPTPYLDSLSMEWGLEEVKRFWLRRKMKRDVQRKPWQVATQGNTSLPFVVVSVFLLLPSLQVHLNLTIHVVILGSPSESECNR